jgi:hypothetical protein
MNFDYSANSRTPSPTASLTSSQSDRFDTFKMKSNPPQKKYHKKQNKKDGNLWDPANGWLPYYRCTACWQVMSRKDPAKCPQMIYACEHIVCAKCIVKSYLVELNPLCPVKDCDTCVNPRNPVKTESLPILSETPPPVMEDEFCECGRTHEKCACHLIERCCNFCGSEGSCHCDDEILPAHYCGDWMCPGDCGMLSCGCIDTCRGRCGLRDW